MIRTIKKWVRSTLDNSLARNQWVTDQLKSFPHGKLLDVGAGHQPYRSSCNHLEYFAQDFGQSSVGVGSDAQTYDYGKIDYKSDCWNIPEKSDSFDFILCTEVLEHIPYPAETIREIHRLLKPSGKLILTVPSLSLRHFDPYWFFPGFSDHYLKKILLDTGFEIIEINETGHYLTWIRAELLRTAAIDRLALLFNLPAILYYSLKYRFNPKKFDRMIADGYYILARKT